MRRWMWIAGGVVVLAVAAGVVWLAADRQTAVDVEDTVERFRSATPAPTAGSTPSPGASGEVAVPDTDEAAGDCPTQGPADVAEGVYVYDTRGGEQLGIPTNPSHDYDGESVMTVVVVPGGFRTTWQPVEERRQQILVCLAGDGGLVQRSSYDARRFLGVTTSRSMACGPDSVQLPPVGAAEGRGTCSGDGTTLTWTTSVVGEEEVTVDGTTIPTVRLSYLGELSGTTQGTVEQDLWYHRESLMQVRRVSRIDARGDTPLGSAAYDETIEMELISLTPRS